MNATKVTVVGPLDDLMVPLDAPKAVVDCCLLPTYRGEVVTVPLPCGRSLLLLWTPMTSILNMDAVARAVAIVCAAFAEDVTQEEFPNVISDGDLIRQHMAREKAIVLADADVEYNLATHEFRVGCLTR